MTRPSGALGSVRLNTEQSATYSLSVASLARSVRRMWAANHGSSTALLTASTLSKARLAAPVGCFGFATSRQGRDRLFLFGR
jgi:hypothetical protein